MLRMGPQKMVIKKIAKLMFLLLLFISGGVLIWKNTLLPKSNEERKTCGCEKCLSDPEDWFMERFQRNITPFMASSYNLSVEDFTWWKNLLSRGTKIEHFRTIQQSVCEFFPGGSAMPEPDPQRCRMCAVVGNSGNLNRSHYGRLIDLHDFVFRINRGPTEGFEEDVGTRTTHRIMYPQSATDLDINTHMVFFPFKTWDLNWLLRGPKGVTKAEWFREVWMTKPVKANKNLVLVANPAFMKYVHHAWLQRRGWYPSTGFLTVVLALHMCDQVSVFGFGADSDGNWSHYYEAIALKWKRLRTGNHPGAIEYKTIVELGKRGKVTFYTGM